MNIEKKFGERVKELRKSLNISQEELAFRAGLHKNYVSDVECGRRNVSLRAIEQFAFGLGVSLKDLMNL
ncbi:MAG: helix-turn-helix transcriptional regulator [Bacilli bacterium]|nr:helix-turn-helix transcriptional regulator [Bacilli bacterium]